MSYGAVALNYGSCENVRALAIIVERDDVLDRVYFHGLALIILIASSQRHPQTDAFFMSWN